MTVEASFGASDSVRGDWSLNVAGNSITLSSVAELPERCYGKSVRLLLTVGLKSNSNLQHYYVANQNPDVLEAHIYNIATRTFNWIGGEPSSTSKYRKDQGDWGKGKSSKRSYYYKKSG